MALKATVIGVEVLPGGTNFYATVHYSDDATPATVLDVHTFEFGSTVTPLTARTVIIAYGQALRTRLTARATKASQFVGQIVDIP